MNDSGIRWYCIGWNVGDLTVIDRRSDGFLMHHLHRQDDLRPAQWHTVAQFYLARGSGRLPSPSLSACTVATPRTARKETEF